MQSGELETSLTRELAQLSKSKNLLIDKTLKDNFLQIIAH